MSQIIVLSWPKCSFGFFCDILWENASELFGQPPNLASLVAQTVKNLPAIQETWVQPLGWEDSLGEGNGNPLQYSGLEKSMDRGAWQASQWVAESQIQMSKFYFCFKSLKDAEADFEPSCL